MAGNRRAHEAPGLPRRVEADIVQAVVAHAYGVPMDELCAGTRRDAYTAYVRHIAMYLTHVAYGYTLDEVAHAFGRDRSTASHACHRIENLRDDPGLDERLNRLEGLLRQASEFEASP